ncbi:MAG: O-antigen ligase family protein [Vicingaceae bacterium]
MSFATWKIWLKTLPLAMKWLVLLILFRPLIDVFYFLKEISPVISPLYIVGVLSPVFILLSLLSKGLPIKFKSIVSDFNFWVWGGLSLFNIVLILFIDFSLDTFGDVLKYITPILLFIYFRRFINSKRQLNGVLTTFLISAIVPAIILTYELIFGPISTQELSANRGGGLRYQGGYADVMNYAIYATGSLLIQAYFFIQAGRKKKRRVFRLLFVFIYATATLIAIKQTASWGVLLAIVFLFFIFNLGSRKGFLVLLVSMPLLVFLGTRVYNKTVEPLIEREIQVIEGDADVDRSFNGRMSRWKKYFQVWEEMPIYSNLFGVITSDQEEARTMVGGGMHSDYVRMLFLTGIIGLLFYLLFLVYLIRKSFRMTSPERFLTIAAITCLLMYSVSTCPLTYSFFTYLIFPIMAYASLPKYILKKEND